MTKPEKYWQLGAVEARQCYLNGVTTPEEVVESALRRTAEVNPSLNAIATLDTEGARRAAAESGARYRQGNPRGPLDGVVFTVKDNITVANLPCMWGTEVFRDFVPTHDETAVARLREAGAIILAKTAVSEFSNGRGIVSTPTFGTTRNPWRLDLTTGSSSGGAAAAVAAGIGSAALATDGGGSIRIPASHCGLVGLKPSAGQVPRFFGLPIIMNGQEVVGVIARNARDIDAIMSAIAGPDEHDAASWPMPSWPSGSFSESEKRSRILFVTQAAGIRPAAEIEEACRRAAENFARLGHVVEVGELPYDHQDVIKSRLMTKAGMAWLLRDKEWRGRVDSYYEVVTDAGLKLTAVDYVEATAAVRRVQAKVGSLFRAYDFVLSPVTTSAPGPADVPIQGDYTAFTAFANIAGIPAVSIPAAHTSEQIPIGVQLVGRFGRDRDLLKMTYEYQLNFDEGLASGPLLTVRAT